MQKVKVKGHSVQKLRVETEGRIDGRMDRSNFIISHAKQSVKNTQINIVFSKCTLCESFN